MGESLRENRVVAGTGAEGRNGFTVGAIHREGEESEDVVVGVDASDIDGDGGSHGIAQREEGELLLQVVVDVVKES